MPNTGQKSDRSVNNNDILSNAIKQINDSSKALTSVIKAITSFSDTVKKSKLDRKTTKTAMKGLMAIGRFTDLMKSIISTLADGMGKLSKDEKLKDSLELLIGSPEVIQETSNITKGAAGDATSIINKVTTGATKGLLEQLSVIPTIIESITNTITINPIKRLITEKKIKILAGYISSLVEGIANALGKEGDLSEMQNTINQASKIMEPIGDILGQIEAISIPAAIKSMLTGIRIKAMQRFILRSLYTNNSSKHKGLLNVLIDMSQDSDIEQLLKASSDTSDEGLVEKISDIVGNILKLIKALDSIKIKTYLKASLATDMLRTFLADDIVNLLVTVASIDTSDAQDNTNSLKSIQGIINNIADIVNQTTNLFGALILLKLIPTGLVLWGVKHIINTITKIVDIINKSAGNDAQINQQFAYIIKTVDIITTSIKRIAINIIVIGLLAIPAAIMAPAALIGTYVILFAIKGIIKILSAMGDARLQAEVEKVSISIRDTLDSLLDSIYTVAEAVLAVILVMLAVSLLAIVVPMLALPFVIGLIALVSVVFIMCGVMKLLALLSEFTEDASKEFLENMVIIALVMLTLSLVFLVLALVAIVVRGHILELIVLLGLMMLVIVAMGAVMALAGLVAPVIVAGSVAIGAVTIGVLCLIALAIMLLLLVFVVKHIDLNAAVDATKRVLAACTEIVQAIFNADFTGGKEPQTGLTGTLIKFVLGNNGDVLLGLIERVAILVLTIIALGAILVLCMLITSIVSMYKKHGKEIVNAPATVSELLNSCAEIIRTVVDSDMHAAWRKDDGVFLTLVTLVFGGELTSVFKLLFKVLIVFLTIIVLAMVRFLMIQLVDFVKYYKDNSTDIDASPRTINIIMDTCSQVIQTITNAGVGHKFNEYDEDGFMRIISFVSPDLAQIVNLLFKIIIIAVTMVVIAMLKLLMNELVWIKKCYDNLGGDNMVENVKTMVGTIMAGIHSIIATLNGQPNEQNKEKDPGASSLLGKLLKACGLNDYAQVADMLAAFPMIFLAVHCVSSIYSVVELMSNSYKKYQALGGANIANNMRNMLTNIGAAVNSMSSTINSMEFAESDKLDENLQNITTTITKITTTFNKLLGSKSNQALGFLVKQTAQYANIVANTDKLVNKVNGLDIAKMNALAKMFGNAAAFSQSINGNFDRLASIINEKIAPLIEGLKTAIENADKTIKDRVTNKPQTSNMLPNSTQTNTPTTSILQPTNSNKNKPVTQGPSQPKLQQNRKLLELAKKQGIEKCIEQYGNGFAINVRMVGR